METLSTKFHDKPKRPVKILQIGEGNFLRAFCDYFIQVLNQETDFDGSVCMVQPRDSHKIGRFNDQDCMFNVITEGLDKGQVLSRADVIDVIDNVLDPYDEYQRFLEYGKSKDLQVVLSNTTESGIRLDETDTDMSSTPKSYPGKLLALLKARYDHFEGSQDVGLHIMPCELISNNGDTLCQIVCELARLNGFDDGFIEWIQSANCFYNTLVDRIVPGFPEQDIESWQNKWDYIDNLAVKGEVYHLWCIQGKGDILSVLPFDKTNLNVVICDDISPYKERKVKILNGAHTFTVSIAYQLGFEVVNKTVGDDRMKQLINRFMYDEVIPTIDLPADDIEQFKDAVFDRFGNPTIQHLWTSIMLNSMGKFSERVMPSAVATFSSTGKLPKLALFSMASLFALYNVKSDDGNRIVEDEPQFNELWNSLYDGQHSNEQIVECALNVELWKDDIASMPGASDFVLQCYNKIVEDGMDAAVDWILENTAH